MSKTHVEVRSGAKDLIFETGKLAKLADGSVVVQYGETVVLVTACASSEVREGIDFFPLTVEYQEKTYAAGRIPGGFFKREGRPTSREILTSRLIDRPIRPLFPLGFYNDVQIIAMVISSDGEYDSDILALNGASAALSISSIPFKGPLAAVRVARVNGAFVLNPAYKERQDADLDLVVVSTRQGVVMLEGEAKHVSEDVVLEAIDIGLKNALSIIQLQEEFARKCGKKKIDFVPILVKQELHEKIKGLYLEKVKEICCIADKDAREEAVHILQSEIEGKFVGGDSPENNFSKREVSNVLEAILQEQVRRSIIDKNTRVDGRSLEDIRQITCEVGILPRSHGSALFTRGQTQSLSITTLGTRSDEQLIESLEGKTYKTFMLHYNFPPFSVGEVKPMRGTGRREIGHGALAEKALKNVMPSKEQFSYTVRVVSEILESNGSSSMATVCAVTLSLMDAGVPITDPVAGVALGLVKDNEKYSILTDINGLEDHYGDMDFKVAGSKKGITAIQLDLKIEYVDLELLKKAFYQSQRARFFILDKISQVISSPKGETSIYAPKIISLKIRQDKIGELIGPGGKNIRKIIELSGATIDIEDDGSVIIASVDSSQAQKALEMVNAIIVEAEVGKTYVGKVKRITNFGAFCEILPGKEGLVHVSELADKFIKSVEEVVKLGDEIRVKVIGIDEQGRINLSKKQAS